jgi:hypothetical protein
MHEYACAYMYVPAAVSSHYRTPVGILISPPTNTEHIQPADSRIPIAKSNTKPSFNIVGLSNLLGCLSFQVLAYAQD